MSERFQDGASARLRMCGLALLGLVALQPPAEGDGDDANTMAAAIVLNGRTMGTTYHMKYWGDGKLARQDIHREVERLLETFDRQMSTYRDDSELSRFNRAPPQEWFAVSAETAHVVVRALEFQRITEGALDVTVAPLLRLWHFGPDGDKQRLMKPPTDKEVQRALKLVGAGRLQARKHPPALWKESAGVEVDLSSIAPGYAVDLIMERLAVLGFANALVEIGGEVRAAGMRPDGEPWRVGIEQVPSGKQAIARVLPLRNFASSTAGDYENFRTVGGKRYTHIIDPRTGQPLPFRGAAVTVIADTCLESDALDTALLVLGPDVGYDWCVKHKAAALFQQRDAAGAVAERATPRFEELIAND